MERFAAKYMIGERRSLGRELRDRNLVMLEEKKMVKKTFRGGTQ